MHAAAASRFARELLSCCSSPRRVGALWARGQLRGSLAAARGHAAAAGPLGAGAGDARRAGHPDHPRRHARGRRARHRVPARAGSLLPDGPRPAPRRRRAGGAGRPARARRSIARSASIASAPRRSAPLSLMSAGRPGGARGLHRRRQRRAAARSSAPPFEYLVLRQDSGAVARRRQPARRAVDVRHAAGHRRRVRVHAGDDARRAAAGDVRRSWRRADPSGMRRSSATPFAVPPIPGPDVYDLRARRTGKPSQHPASRPNSDRVELGVGSWELGVDEPAKRRGRQQQLRGRRAG